jgi:eukaryotic-like serine/threonine-protein kinase
MLKRTDGYNRGPMQAGERVAGRFELEELAQAGGMGAVWRAHDRMTGQRVAVKILRTAGADHEARFQREAELLGGLSHEAIVRHIAHGRTPGGDLYLAMEWLEGEDLARRLKRGPATIAEALALGRRAATALAVLHAGGGVHRDLKPANLFLEGGRFERAKLLDFGIARAGALAAALTRTGALMGTPGYTAPEQARGARELDARVDVFALGCVLFECLTGKPAFAGEHIMAILARILLDEPPRVRQHAPEVEPALDALIARMMDRDPARRPRDAAEVLLALEALDPGGAGLARGSIPPQGAPPPALTDDEQRFMCLVLVAEGARAASAHVAELPTLAGTAPVGLALSPQPHAAGSGAGAASEPTLTPGQGGHVPEHLRALAAAHGLRLELLTDGHWVAAATSAHAPATDQATQAARCALALQRALPLARIAIVSGRGLKAGGLPVGEVIDRGVRLLAPRRGDGHVRVDALTAGLCGARFQLGEPDGDGRVLLGERQDSEDERRLLGRATPFVGRDRELSTLLGLFDDCAAEPAARAVLVRAPAGFGKSRLRDELLRLLGARGEPFTLLRARGDSMSAGSPFGLAAQALRQAAGLRGGEPLPEQRARLNARLGEQLSGEGLARVSAFLGELCDVPAALADAPLAAARRDPLVMGDQIRRAWEDWLAAECAARPVLLVLDDLHLGDLPTVKLVDAALRHLRDQPLMVLALARPEVHATFPGLWAERQLQEIPLPELSRKAALRLAREVLGEGADSAALERVVAQAAGNAFYLEELLRVLAAGTGEALPQTVLAMVQARLEGLGAEGRRLLRAASIFGERFWRGGVVALGGAAAHDVDARLYELCEREVIVHHHESAYAGQDEYAFRYSLVCEAAYARLTDGDRALGHRLAGEWLERAGERDALLLGEHFERGGERERAASWYARAAREALEGNDLESALARVERGLACGARAEVLGELLLYRAEAHRWRADFAAAAEAGSLAMAALAPASAPWYQAASVLMQAYSSDQLHERELALIERLRAAPRQPEAATARASALCTGVLHLYTSGRYDLGDELIHFIEAEAGPEDERDPDTAARLLEAYAYRAGARAEQGKCLELLAGAAAAFQRGGDLRNACRTSSAVGYTWLQLGAYEQAVDSLEATLKRSERLGLPAITPVVRQNLGLAAALGGDLERGEAEERAALDALFIQADVRMVGITRVYLGQILMMRGELEAAEREIAPAAQELRTSPPALAMALAAMAQVRLKRGDVAGALAPAEEAQAVLASLGGMDEGEAQVRLAYAEALLAVGREKEAAAAAEVARARVEELADKLALPALRRAFLERVPENAAILQLADRLSSRREA